MAAHSGFGSDRGSDFACTTYRYLRLTVVGLMVLLIVSVAWEIVHDHGELRGSISAYYYVAPRSIFVGALVGMGAALIAIKARAGVEDTLLNIAGMLAPIVAMVPTPVAPDVAGGCAGASRCIPPEFLGGVDNNVWSLLIVGAGALVVSGVIAWRSGRRARIRLMLAVALWLLVLVSFLAWRTAFLFSAHYASAATLFLLIVVVVVINARHARRHLRPPLFSAQTYGWIYRIIAGVMALAAIVAAVSLILDRSGLILPDAWLFAVESAMVFTFTAFWLVQTAQFWRVGVPESA